MPKTKRKTVRKVKKIKQKQTTNVVVNIDQSRRTRTTRREPKQQYQPAPQQISFKPSYGSTEDSGIAKAITLLLANNLNTPKFNGGTTHTPTVKLSTGNKVNADTQTPSLRPPPVKSEALSPKSERSYPLEGSTHTSDLYPTSPDRANDIPVDDYDRELANIGEFLTTVKKNKEERDKYRASLSPASPRQLSFYDEETGGGATRQSPPKTPQTSPDRMNQAKMLEDALQDYTAVELRKFYQAVFKRELDKKITAKQTIIAQFDLKRRNKSTLDHLENYMANYVTDDTKNVTTRKKVPTLGIRT